MGVVRVDGGTGQGTLTILFTDVEGSTAFRTSAGDAAGNQVMAAHDRFVVEQVARHEGRHVKSLGDGAMAVFASPRRAVECAVAVQRAAMSSPLRVRMGLNAGEVTLVGDDVFGSAVNAAARIAAKAQGGEIFVSDVVRQLIGSAESVQKGLELRDRGRVRLRGFPDRWRLYEVVWRDERSVAGNPELIPLVGRAAELARLHRVLDNLVTGRGASVVIRGEAGIGKTRLATEALDHAQSRGWRVLTGRASPFGGGLGLEPIVEAFGGLLRGLDGPALHALVDDLPHLSRLFDGIGLPAAPQVGDPALERTLLFEAVARLLERLAAQTPVVLLIDDIQWADPASLELLHQLGRGIERHPAALVLTHRSGESDESDRVRQLLTALRRLRIVEEIDLVRLDPSAVEALAREFLGGPPPAGLLAILVRAAGTPLFVDALLRALVDRGQLTRAGDAWTLTGGDIEVPTAVRDVILERLDGLEPTARRVVDLVSLTGGALSYEVLADTGELDTEILAGAVEKLTSSGVLAEEMEADDLALRLAHPLYYEVGEGAMAVLARRRGHAVLARALERQRPDDLEGLGRHYLAAGPALDRVRALEVLAEAGARASRRGSYMEAVSFLDAAVTLARKEVGGDALPRLLELSAAASRGAGRTDAAVTSWTEALDHRRSADDDIAVTRIRRALGIAEFDRGRLVEAREHLAAAALLAGDLPTAELADLHMAQVTVLVRLGLGDELRAVADQLEEVAAELGSARARAQSHYARSAALMAGGHPAEAREHALAGLPWALEATDDAVAYRLHTVCCDANLVLGDHALMLDHSREGQRLADALGVGTGAGGAALYRMFAAIQSGAWDDALAHSAAEVEVIRRLDNARLTVTVLGFRAWILALRGDLADASEVVAELTARFPSSMYADRRGFAIAPAVTARVAMEREQPASALSVLEAAGVAVDPGIMLIMSLAEVRARATDPETRAAALADLPDFESPLLVAERGYIDGLVGLAEGISDAVRSLAESAARFDALAMPFHAARSRLELGAALSTAEPATAIVELQRALAVFQVLPAKRYVERAEALLATLGVKPEAGRTRTRRSGTLSRREQEVAVLVAEGLTNAEIAARLTVSVRTVTSHLDHIYTRLGIGSRMALARQVATQPDGFRDA